MKIYTSETEMLKDAIKDLQAQIEHQQRTLNQIAWLAQRQYDPNEQLTDGYTSESQAGSEA